MRTRRAMAVATIAGALAACTLVAGCASKHRVASVASSFLPLTGAPVLSPGPGIGSPVASTSAPVPASSSAASPASISPSPTAPASQVAVSPTSSPANDDFTSPTPCPVPPPQQFVEGTSATAQADGSVVFNYRMARRLCGGPDDGQFVTVGKTDLHATVDPSALVLLLPPDGSTQTRQVPVGALPAAIAANNQAPYYAIIFDTAGSIIRIEQYFHP